MKGEICGIPFTGGIEVTGSANMLLKQYIAQT
jgi:hypothetical protein